MHQRILLFLTVPIFLLAACAKNTSNYSCPYKAPTTVAGAGEVATLKAYLDTNHLPYTQHPSGIFYNITAAGTGTTSPEVCSAVLVKYSGRLLTTTTPFDHNEAGVAFTLGQLITGWQYGIPLLKKGGSITLYIPPSLGYGVAGSGSTIPPNSNLIFTIELVDFQ